MDMATNNGGQGRNHSDADPAARNMYARFMSVTKWAVILVVLALVLMALFLV